MPKGYKGFQKGHSCFRTIESYKCSNETREKLRQSHLGKVFSQETRLKMSQKAKGKIPWNKGKKNCFSKEIINKLSKALSLKRKEMPSWNKGLKLSEEHKRKLSGENSVHWKGGISFEPYPLGWTKTYKEQIRYRDKYKCQLCSIPEIETKKKLCIHHIDYNKKNIKENNLISLCQQCHTKTNFNRKSWINYFEKFYVRN